MSPYNQFKLLIIKYLSEILLYFIRTSLKYIIYCNIPPRLNRNNVVFFFLNVSFYLNLLELILISVFVHIPQR